MILPARNQLSAVVALGGGGARGLSHFGALRAILECDYSIDRIVGTSIGSMAGGVYAALGDLRAAIDAVMACVTSPEFRAKQVALCGANPVGDTSHSSGLVAWYDRMKSYLWARHLLTRVFRRRSLLSSHLLEDVVNHLVPDIDISETRVPLSIVTVDLRSGHQVVLERGSLRKAILASTAIPGIFPPIEWDQYLLSDFGVLESLPTQVANAYKSVCASIIAVDVGPAAGPVDDCESALHILLRMDEIGETLLRKQSLLNADIVIRPHVGNVQWYDFSQPERLIASGLLAGRAILRRPLDDHSLYNRPAPTNVLPLHCLDTVQPGSS